MGEQGLLKSCSERPVSVKSALKEGKKGGLIMKDRVNTYLGLDIVTGALPFLTRGVEEEGTCSEKAVADAGAGCVWATLCRLDRRDAEEGCSTAVGGELARPVAFLRFLDEEGCAVDAVAVVPNDGSVRFVAVGAAASAVNADAAVVASEEGLD